MGIPSKTFCEMHPEKAKDILRLINEYIKTVRSSAGIGSGSGAGAGSGRNNLNIELDPNGFPIVPSIPSWDKISKEELEKLYRNYITQHYRGFIGILATLCY